MDGRYPVLASVPAVGIRSSSSGKAPKEPILVLLVEFLWDRNSDALITAACAATAGGNAIGAIKTITVTMTTGVTVAIVEGGGGGKGLSGRRRLTAECARFVRQEDELIEGIGQVVLRRVDHRTIQAVTAFRECSDELTG
jgi:hypothetical protein